MPCFPLKPQLFASLLAVALTSPVIGAASDWSEGLTGRANGATRDYYNGAAKLPWRHFMGDWRDAKGVAQGNDGFASAKIEDTDAARFIEWDVTSLCHTWFDGKYANQGFFLRTKSGNIIFASREHATAGHRPQLVIKHDGGSVTLGPTADTFLTRSTYRSQGHADTLRVSSGPDHTLLRFDLTSLNKNGAIKLKGSKATLRLYTLKQYGDADVGVFRCEQGHQLPPSKPIDGLAARYPKDQGIGADPNVIFATDFESETWHKEWTYAGKMEVIDVVSQDKARKFEPLAGKALRVRVAKGSTGALNTLFKFKKQGSDEPESIYLRYYLRFGDDWNQTIQGGKMPGISGTYGVAGWGGRKVNGTNGWSARGHFGQTIPKGNPLAGLHPIGTYCYHADMKGNYGSVWGWHNDYRGFLEGNRWYAVEQHLKLNTPSKNDGVLRAWVDGRLAFEKKDIRFRDVDKLKIEQIWMNVYHGGTQPSPYDQHLFIDNVVIAKDYIGPMK